MEQLDEYDEIVVRELGYAVARAQLFEYALAKVLEVQRHDLTTPLDDRWDEVIKWLRMTAGAAARQLNVTPDIAADLARIVERRNLVAHHIWRFYVMARGRRGERASREFADWLVDQSALMGKAYNGLMGISHAARQIAPASLSGEIMQARWRTRVSNPVGEFWFPPINAED